MESPFPRTETISICMIAPSRQFTKTSTAFPPWAVRPNSSCKMRIAGCSFAGRQQTGIRARRRPAANEFTAREQRWDSGTCNRNRGFSFYVAPSWSPDGNLIATAINQGDKGTSGIFIYSVSRHESVILPFTKSLDSGSWLPDQSGLLVTAATGLFQGRQIWLRSPTHLGSPNALQMISTTICT
jgi:hypothetical protein